jgi:hypothetical protein
MYPVSVRGGEDDEEGDGEDDEGQDESRLQHVDVRGRFVVIIGRGKALAPERPEERVRVPHSDHFTDANARASKQRPRLPFPPITSQRGKNNSF